MPAEVETMAYTGAVPWHGLGVAVAGDLTPDEMLQAAGLDWPVEKWELFAVPDGYLDDGTGEPAFVPNKYAIVRGTDGHVLDIVGPQYKPVQNRDALEFFSDFVSAGDMTMETAGSLATGRRIWGLASLADGFTLAGGDEVQGYLLLCSPHICGEAFTIKLTAVRVVCNNTLTWALNQQHLGPGVFRMDHRHEFDADMKEAARRTLGLASERLEEFEQQAKQLAAVHAERQQLVEYAAVLSGSKIVEAAVAEVEAEENGNGNGSPLEAAIAATEAMDLVKGIQETDLDRVGKKLLDSILESPGSDLTSAEDTWWGALAGVTHATDHVLGRNADSRLNSAWFGDRAKMKARALDLAVEYTQQKGQA